MNTLAKTRTSIADQAYAHLTRPVREAVLDLGSVPAESWTVWLHRHRPVSTIWMIGLTPSPDLRADGFEEFSTRAQLRTDPGFEGVWFNSTLIGDDPIPGLKLSTELQGLVAFLIERASDIGQ